MRIPSALLGAVAVLGCSNDITPPYADIAATFVGPPMTGTSQGVAMNATLTVSITETSNTLGGSYTISGTMLDGTRTYPINFGGTLSGTIAPGSNPSVTLTLHDPLCSTRSSTFSGTYDSTAGRLMIAGSVQYFNDVCSVEFSYPETVVLSR